MRWLSHRHGVPDPFVELEAPPKPRQEGDWLTPEEFALVLAAAGRPLRQRRGLAQRDRLVLLALVTTGLRRSELIGVDWRDLDLDRQQPSLLVRRGKGGRPRRQPLAPPLAAELRALRDRYTPAPGEPVFRGLAGRRLQPATLAETIRRAAERAGLEKRVTAHTLRHTAATWLRQATGDARLVAEYLGHADLSTQPLRPRRPPGAARRCQRAGRARHRRGAGRAGEPRGPIEAAARPRSRLRAPGWAGSVGAAVWSAAGRPGRAPAPSGSIETAVGPPRGVTRESLANRPIENPRLSGGFP